MTGPAGSEAQRRAMSSMLAVPQIPQLAVATVRRSAIRPSSSACRRWTMTVSSGREWVVGSPSVTRTISSRAARPSVTRKPTASSSSWPGVRMVTATSTAVSPGPAAMIWSGSSPASVSVRAVATPRSTVTTRASACARWIGGRAHPARARSAGVSTSMTERPSGSAVRQSAGCKVALDGFIQQRAQSSLPSVQEARHPGECRRSAAHRGQLCSVVSGQTDQFDVRPSREVLHQQANDGRLQPWHVAGHDERRPWRIAVRPASMPASGPSPGRRSATTRT